MYVNVGFTTVMLAACWASSLVVSTQQDQRAWQRCATALKVSTHAVLACVKAPSNVRLNACNIKIKHSAYSTI